MLDQVAAAGLAQGHVTCGEHHVAGGMAIAIREILGLFADHRGDDPGNIDAIHRPRAGDLAVAQHGDVVTHRDQFFEPVRDIHNADALLLEVGDDLEQNCHFLRRQCRRRLVKDQDLRILGQSLGNLDDLLLTDTQVASTGVGANVLLKSAHQRSCAFGDGAGIDVDAGAGRLAADIDVFGHRHVREQIQFLKHDADAGGDGVILVTQDQRLAVQRDLTFGKFLDPGDHFHQRRFSGAVLADQHVDRAHTDIEIDALQRAGAGIDLDRATDRKPDRVLGGGH